MSAANVLAAAKQSPGSRIDPLVIAASLATTPTATASSMMARCIRVAE